MTCCETKASTGETLYCDQHYAELFEDKMEPEYSDTTPINNVGELIRALSFWSPNTPVEIAHADDGEPMDIVQTNYGDDTLTFLVE